MIRNVKDADKKIIAKYFYLECQQYYVGLSCYMYVDFQRAIIQWFLGGALCTILME